jgi:hypothetical protein
MKSAVNVKHWLALVFAPTTALAAQSVMYGLVSPSCSEQARLHLHLAAAVALAIVVVLGVLAFSESSLHRGEPGSKSDEGGSIVPRRLLANVAVAVAALSALVILAMWFTLWVLTPCEP